MVEIKDSGSEFHISRPRLVGCGFSIFVTPIFLAFAAFHQSSRGAAVATITYACLTALYVKRDVIRRPAVAATILCVFAVQVMIGLLIPFQSVDPVPVFLSCLILSSILTISAGSIADRLSAPAANGIISR